MGSKCVIGLEGQQITIVKNEKPLGIVAGEIEDGLAGGAETVGAANRHHLAEKIRSGIKSRKWIKGSARGCGVHKLGVLARGAVAQQIMPTRSGLVLQRRSDVGIVLCLE